ncbi:MAG: 50S ribosomal protein L29 [bacterium]
MKNSEVRQLTDKELEERMETEQTNLNTMRLNHAVSPLDNPLKIKDARKNVARLKTEIRNRQIENSKKS